MTSHQGDILLRVIGSIGTALVNNIARERGDTHWMDVSNEELSGGLVTGVSLGLRNGHIKTRKVRLVIVPGDVDQMASDTVVLLDLQTTA